MFGSDAAGIRLPGEAPAKRRRPEGGGRSGEEEEEGSGVEDGEEKRQEMGGGTGQKTKVWGREGQRESKYCRRSSQPMRR